MSTLLLLRHGLTAMTGPVLAGRAPLWGLAMVVAPEQNES